MTDDPPPKDCEASKWHSRQKHEFLKAYLSIWTDHVGRGGSSRPPLEVVDGFAAFGWCRSIEPEVSKAPWEGTAVLAAKALVKYPAAKRLILNSYDPANGPQQGHQLGCLKRAIAKVAGVNPRFAVEYLAEPIGDAVTHAEGIMDFRYPTLWLLDPYSPEELTTIERIATHSYTYTTKRGTLETRRPEMFITLMTQALQRNVDLHPEMITSALGLPESDWRTRVEEMVRAGANKRQALISIYGQRLRALYDRPPIVIEVQGSGRNIIYALFLCSNHDAGQFMMLSRKLRQYSSWREHEWTPQARRISRDRSRQRKAGDASFQAGLDSDRFENG